MPPQTDITPLAACPADLMAPVPVPRRVKPGRHAAPTVKPQLLPGLLLLSAGAAFAGLSAMPARTASVPGIDSPADVLAIGGPDPFSDLVVSLNPPLPKPVVKAKAVTAKAAANPAPTAELRASRSAPRAAITARSTTTTVETPSVSRSTASVSEAAYARPCNGTLTSSFGQRWGRLHAGLDFGAPTGTPIYAVADAVVLSIEYAGESGGYGNLTKLQHPDGTVTYYAHQSQIMVSVGEAVAAGETIGLVGNTGNSTGPHLHFEVHPAGQGPINPKPWLRERGIF